MKLQNLAVMFVIFILPISMVLTSYIDSRVETLSLQTTYDSRLNKSTYDAIKAYQINTYNGDESILANSKIRDIEAAVNSFFNSIESAYRMNGYTKEDLQSYVPALVFTLYDGYYIYSPYTNTWDQEAQESYNKSLQEVQEAGQEPDITYQDGETLYGLKPYVYYSARYVSGSLYDVVITYAIDNYITIRGLCNDEPVDIAGYLLTDVAENSSGQITYKGITIDVENNVRENVMVDGVMKYNLPCKVISGTKYYYDAQNNEVFHLLNGTKIADTGMNPNDIINNDNAVNYYRQALELKEFIQSSPLRNLRTNQVVDENGNPVEGDFGNYEVFAELFNTTGSNDIENDNSLFNSHRQEVIKYTIERNLSIAITNYNNYSGSNDSTNFQMPMLKDYEWEIVANNVSLISFLQGLSIGGKIYNGYTVVPNMKNKESVQNNSIYILTNDNTYNIIKSQDLDTKDLTNAIGIFNMNFERKAGQNVNGITQYYFPIEDYYGIGQMVTASYTSVVNQRDLKDGTIFEVVDQNQALAKIYYTALGRERYGQYRT